MKDRRRGSYVLAGLVSIAVLAWFGSGALPGPADRPGQSDENPGNVPSTSSISVGVQEVTAETVTEDIRLQGHTAPNRQVTVRAETAGRVTELLAERGAQVRAGEPVVRLAIEDRGAQERKAEALVTQRQRDYAAIRKLAEQGHLAGTRVDEALANLEAARADLARIEQDIAKTTLKAPFDGILDDRNIELGDFVAVRDPVFTIVDVRPLIVSAAIAQRDRAAIATGDESTVRLITGEESPGTVRYLSATSDEETRTFSVEIRVSNPNGTLPTGVSAEVVIPARAKQAHRLAPGWLVRTDDDQFGVYLVDAAARAKFVPVSIVRANPAEIWVTGLPDPASVVSAGQGFLQEGQVVHVAQRESAVEADDRTSRIAAGSRQSGMP